MQKTYRVSFFKRLADSYGHPVEPCQGAVEVRATDQGCAVALARRRFAEMKDVADWSLRADYETVELPAPPASVPERVRRHRVTPAPS